jgi:DNA-directed RNA polymerase I, II, and III subunit RPABC1
MLTDRKYTIPAKYDVDLSEFTIMYNNGNYDIVATHNINSANPPQQIYVTFVIESKTFTKKDLINIVEKIKLETENNDINIVIVLKNKPNNAIKKEMANKAYENVEIFLLNQVIINITKHVIVPKHILLDDTETKQFLEKYSCTANQLPKILSSDPVAKYYGMKSGQICKIIRPSPATGESISYRYVK